jgi:hypothetical protein
VISAGQRCSNHAGREAAARCPECRSFFCRECVTEHEGRVLCASCIRKLTAARAAPNRSLLRRLAGVLPLGLGLLTAWLFFYLLGRSLLLRQPEAPASDESGVEAQ